MSFSSSIRRFASFCSTPRASSLCAFALLVTIRNPLLAAEAPPPQWIWAPGAAPPAPETVFLRHTFVTPHLNWRATLTVVGGEPALVQLNGESIARTTAWDQSVRVEISVKLRQGTNVLGIQATRSNNPAGFLARLDLGGVGGDRTIVSDDSWRASRTEESGWSQPGFDARRWPPAAVLGSLGDAPWGNPLDRPAATPAADIQVQPGFQVELLRSAQSGEGSWICLATDPQGRLWISAQGDSTPLLRMTLDDSNQVVRVERITAPIRYAMGLLFAHDSLYVNGRGPNGSGLYRLIDANHNDQFEPDELRLLQSFKGEGEHGYHAVALGPDNQIYVLNGNGTAPPPNLSTNSPYRHFSGDALSAVLDEPDAARRFLGAPSGHILRTDPDGRSWELWMGGLRNAYDFAFDPDGELFTFDSDMEWDWGAPWYRPTRVFHCVPGADYGWRSGTEWWPDDHPDTLPPVVNIGIGSPTGVRFGTRSHFPERYRRALFLQDWSYGRILAVHLEPRGASYIGTYEPFLSGRPLNLTSMDFGRDGSLFFTTGGRGTHSGLYRVRATANQTDPRQPLPPRTDPASSSARSLRRDLESRSRSAKPEDLPFLWSHLASPESSTHRRARTSPTNSTDARRSSSSGPVLAGIQSEGRGEGGPVPNTTPSTRRPDTVPSNTSTSARPSPSPGGEGRGEGVPTFDPFIRHAARIALEHLPLSAWQDRALSEPDPSTALVSLLALARCSPPQLQPRLFEALARFQPNSLPPEQQMLLLRTIEISLFRHGLPAPQLVRPLLARIAPLYPANRWPLNREVSRLLLYLKSPDLLEPTLQLLNDAPTQEQQIHYLGILRHLRNGWSLDHRRQILTWWQTPRSSRSHPPELHRWFAEVGRTYTEGAQLYLKLDAWREQFIDQLSDTERKELATLLAPAPAADAPPPPAPRQFVKEWTLAELTADAAQPIRERNFGRGRKAYIDAQCALCHRIENFGGAVGPELTGAGAKYTARDLLDAILEPSKVVSEQYQDTTVTLKGGDELTGRLVSEDADLLVLVVNPLKPVEHRLRKSDIVSRTPARLSPMPEGLLNVLTRDDILDLLAYLQSGANRQSPMFR